MSLINFFDNRRFWGGKRNKFLSKIYFYPLCNRITDIAANFILPIYFHLTRNNPAYSIKENKREGTEKVIVSLTSFSQYMNISCTSASVRGLSMSNGTSDS